MSQFKPKSLVVYRIQKALELDKLDEQLSELKYTPCGPNDMARSGWIPPLGEDVELLKHESNNLILLTVKHESKILPPATIKEIVRTRVQKLEKEQNRRLKKMEIQAVNDAVLAELIPKAFSKYSTTNIWVDTKSRLLLVETTSHKKADDVTALLR
ncbi:TPA: recombination-associated protein RdgC, partial [Enterobacter kobei]|nr:recombination-associated protein RdgC [Enterobacter kobei]